MNKVAIVTDSNSGISQENAQQLGLYVLPMPFNINSDTYYEDISLSREEFYKYLEGDADIMTSQPSIDAVLSLWDGLLEEYDQVVHIPMSSGLSGSCDTALALARDYEGKVFVVNNQRISVTLRQSALNALLLAKEGKTGEEILRILEEQRLDATIYLVLDTLKYLKKGGRVTPAAAALGTILRIKPVLQIQGDKLDAFAKARTIKQAKSIMIDAVKKDIERRFQVDGSPENIEVWIAHSNNKEAAEEFKEELQTVFPGHDIMIADISLSVACHTGPGILAVACAKRMRCV